MISTIITFIGARKWLQYIILGALFVVLLLIAYAKVKATGANEERVKQLEATVKKAQQDAKLRAEIERLDTDTVRRRLRERWSSK